MAKNKLSRQQQKHIDRTKMRLQRIAEYADMITEDKITTLVQRNSISAEADGYSSGSGLKEYSAGSKNSGSTTENTVLQRQYQKYDPLDAAAKHIDKLITAADVCLRIALNTYDDLFRQETEARGRQTGNFCLVCHKLPAEKAGYCKRDYDRWSDYGRPDRLRWELWVNEEKTDDGILMVSSCPPPGPNHSARRGPWSREWAAQPVETYSQPMTQ